MGNLVSTNNTTQNFKNSSIQNPSSCSKVGNCATGFQKGSNGICTAGWSYSCGQNCAQNNCRNSGGTWIPANYNISPYLCKPKTVNIRHPLTLFTNSSFNGQSECFPKEGKYNSKLNEVKSLKIDNNYLAILYSGSGLTGNFVSVYKNTSGNLLNAKSVALIQNGYHPVALSSKPVEKVGPNFYLKYGLYPNIKNESIGSYTVSSANPYYSKQSNDGIMFYSEEVYNGKSFYLGTSSPTTGQAKMGFVPKSVMIFKADKIYFYQDANLQGGEIAMEVKAYKDLAEEFRTSDITQSSSISIPEGRIAFLYTEIDFKGKKLILSAGAYNLPEGWNDQVKSAHFFTLEELKKYQAPAFHKAREEFLSQNPALTKYVKITDGWENTEFNIVAKNELGSGSCASNGKIKDIGLYTTQPETFVLDFYAGLFTKSEAEFYARDLKVPYFGYVLNSGMDISYNELKPNQKLHYFGGFTINSTYTEELNKYNEDGRNFVKFVNLVNMPQSVFGTNLHVCEIKYQSRNIKQCINFVDKANEMNGYALEMNDENCQTLYKNKKMVLELQNKI